MQLDKVTTREKREGRDETLKRQLQKKVEFYWLRLARRHVPLRRDTVIRDEKDSNDRIRNETTGAIHDKDEKEKRTNCKRRKRRNTQMKTWTDELVQTEPTSRTTTGIQNYFQQRGRANSTFRYKTYSEGVKTQQAKGGGYTPKKS